MGNRVALGGRASPSLFGGKPERSESDVGLARRGFAAALDIGRYQRTDLWIITANPFRRATNPRARRLDAGIGRKIEIMNRDDGLGRLIHVPSYRCRIRSAEKGRGEDECHAHI